MAIKKTYIGLSRSNGGLLHDDAHIKQSILDILTTDLGSRVMRREYGSILYRLLDKPLDQLLIMQLYAATALAVTRWEPRVRLVHIAVQRTGQGSLIISITYNRTGSLDPQDAGYFKFEVTR